MRSPYGDITSTRLLAAKGVLFLLSGGLASGGVVVGVVAGWEIWPVLAMHGLAVWSFCRAYYFAFYVLEKYVEPRERYAGLTAAAVRTWRLLRGRPGTGG